jgi:hypothetical protein
MDNMQQELPIKFEISNIFMGIIYINYIIVIIWFSVPFKVPNPQLLDYLIFFTIGAIWFGFTTYEIMRLKSSYILVTNDEIEFKYGKKHQTVSRRDITSAISSIGHIVISTNAKKTALVIPMTFKRSSELLALVMTH